MRQELHEDGRLLERALAEHGATGHGRYAAAPATARCRLMPSLEHALR